MRNVSEVLSSVVCPRFGMNQHTEEFGRRLLEMDFQFGLDIVDASQRQIVREGAMAGDVKTSSNFLDLDVVGINDFWKLPGRRLEVALEAGVAEHLVAGFDGGRLAFYMREDGGDLGHVAAHIGFEVRDLVVGSL